MRTSQGSAEKTGLPGSCLYSIGQNALGLSSRAERKRSRGIFALCFCSGGLKVRRSLGSFHSLGMTEVQGFHMQGQNAESFCNSLLPFYFFRGNRGNYVKSRKHNSGRIPVCFLFNPVGRACFLYFPFKGSGKRMLPGTETF